MKISRKEVVRCLAAGKTNEFQENFPLLYRYGAEAIRDSGGFYPKPNPNCKLSSIPKPLLEKVKKAEQAAKKYKNKKIVDVLTDKDFRLIEKKLGQSKEDVAGDNLDLTFGDVWLDGGGIGSGKEFKLSNPYISLVEEVINELFDGKLGDIVYSY